MNSTDLQKMKDYRAAISAVRVPSIADKVLSGYMAGALSKALGDLDAAIEMREPSLVTPSISQEEAEERGLVPVGALGKPDAWWHSGILRDMARDDIETAMVREGDNGEVAVWRRPSAFVAPVTISTQH